MAEIYSDLLDVIEAMVVTDAAAIDSIQLMPERGECTATFSFLRVMPREADDSASEAVEGFEVQRLPKSVYRIAVREPVGAQLEALQESGLLGTLEVAQSHCYGGDRYQDQYIVKTHAGSLRERVEWLQELSEDVRRADGIPS